MLLNRGLLDYAALGNSGDEAVKCTHLKAVKIRESKVINTINSDL